MDTHSKYSYMVHGATVIEEMKHDQVMFQLGKTQTIVRMASAL